MRRVEVEGESMSPTLEPGDRLLVARWGRVRPCDIAVVIDPRDRTRPMVKRVTDRHDDGSVTVVGDNPSASTDSREFGPVPRDLVRGRILRRY